MQNNGKVRDVHGLTIHWNISKIFYWNKAYIPFGMYLEIYRILKSFGSLVRVVRS